MYWAHQRGLQSEEKVISEYTAKGFVLLHQRLKTPYAEVDLVLRSPSGDLVMIEVKTVNHEIYFQYRISRKQKSRLLRAHAYLCERYDSPVEVHWAFVTKAGEVTLFEDISG